MQVVEVGLFCSPIRNLLPFLVNFNGKEHEAIEQAIFGETRPPPTGLGKIQAASSTSFLIQ
jgi:hypothetical protein